MMRTMMKKLYSGALPTHSSTIDIAVAKEQWLHQSSILEPVPAPSPAIGNNKGGNKAVGGKRSRGRNSKKAEDRSGKRSKEIKAADTRNAKQGQQ